MTDGIQKGAGNAYALQAPPNLLSLYPDWQSFAQAWATGQVFTDLRLNPEGWNPLGTSLNRVNLLKDTTATAMGLTASAVPDEAFAKLRDLASTAQSTANGKTKAEMGTYLGHGLIGKDNPNSLHFSFAAKLVLVTELAASGRSFAIFIRPANTYAAFAQYSTTWIAYPTVSWNGNNMSWYANETRWQLSGRTTYSYLAIG